MVTFRLAGQSRAWADSVDFLPPETLEHFYQLTEKVKQEEAEALAQQAFSNAKIEASKQQ